jgi:hypothetical protein
MSEKSDLFAQDSPSVKPSPVKSWQMVTNQSNLFYMIAAGMIMPPDGFGGKYYLDTVSAFPGYLPIFPNNVSESAINFSISEKSHLLPCILNLELSELSGPVKIITQEGDVKDLTFPEDVDGSCQLMLVPAPLPMNFVNSIVYRSREDKIRCEKDAADFNNVDLSSFSIKTTAGAFNKLKSQNWPLKDITVDPVRTVLDVPMAAGAMMGLLLNMNNCDDLSILAGRLAFDPDISLPELASHPVIAAMGVWFKKGEVDTGDVSQKLFWDIVGRVAASKYAIEQTNAIDVAVNYLETMPSDQFDDKTRSYGERLAADLRAILGLADNTISEIFERHPKPVSRAMTLFVLREKIEDLLEFSNPQLTEADYILAAILFAAREGWIGLSKDLREFPGLGLAVSHRIAQMSHRLSGTQIYFSNPPSKPETLFRLLSSDSGPLSKSQNDAALYVARKMKWDCIETRIKLGKGDYQLEVTSSGIQLKLDGDINAVVTGVMQGKFKDYLCNSVIPAKLDRKVREILKVAK